MIFIVNSSRFPHLFTNKYTSQLNKPLYIWMVILDTGWNIHGTPLPTLKMILNLSKVHIYAYISCIGMIKIIFTGTLCHWLEPYNWTNALCHLCMWTPLHYPEPAATLCHSQILFALRTKLHNFVVFVVWNEIVWPIVCYFSHIGSVVIKTHVTNKKDLKV